MNTPFFSIVIANYNYGAYLEEAINSVLNQSCQDFELIIIDGGSTDSSVEIIRKYEQRISWWVSEPDRGQSNAFNKGFQKAKGKFLSWLNADDILLQDTLLKVKQKLESHPNIQWATGNFLRFRDDSKKIIEAKWGPHFLPSYLQTFDSPLVIFGPTTFWSAKVYLDVGEINEDLHYSMDTDYWIRMLKKGYKQIRINHTCWAFRMHETSKTAEYGDHTLNEEIKHRQLEEKLYELRQHGYKENKFKRILGYVMRIVDGSMFVAAYRYLFVVGSYVHF